MLEDDIPSRRLGAVQGRVRTGENCLARILRDRLGIADGSHWKVYVPVLLLSVVAMVPVVGFGERRRIMHRLLPWVVLALLVAELGLLGGLGAGLGYRLVY